MRVMKLGKECLKCYYIDKKFLHIFFSRQIYQDKPTNSFFKLLCMGVKCVPLFWGRKQNRIWKQSVQENNYT